MSDILNLISTSSQNNEERYKFIQDLLVKKSDVPFANEEVNLIQNTLLSLINNQLNHSSTRHDGLKLLLKVLPRCSKDSLTKHGVLWMTKALQILDVAQNDDVQVTTACEVIAKLAIASKEIPELQKQVSMQNVKQIIAHVNGLNEEKRFGAVFYLLAVLLYHYPEPCERQQVTIKRLILPLVDSGEENLVRAGAKCFTLLTSATERSFQAPPNRQQLTAWTYAQVLICNNLHETMDSLFVGVTEIEQVEIWDKLDLPNIPQTDVMLYYLGLERRFNNLCVHLGTLLRGCGPKNSVSPANIFKVLSRGLFVTPRRLGTEDSFRKQILHLILPNLHSSLLHVLDAMVSGFGKELVPYAQTILQLLQQILDWTITSTENSITLDGSRPFKNTRIKAYRSLSTWLMHVGLLSGFDKMCLQFIADIFKDIVPEREQVVLSVQKTHNMSKRALKRHREKQYDNSLSQNGYVSTVSNPLSNADLAETALITFQDIFLHTGCRLERVFYESSQTILVDLLNKCYLETDNQTFYTRIGSCRLNLLRTLRMLQLNPHPSVAPSTQYCLEIYQMAQNDSDLNVSQEAKIGLYEIEKTVHPAAPTLRLPISVETENPADKEAESQFEMIENRNTRPEEVIESETGAEEVVDRSFTPIEEREEENRSADEPFAVPPRPESVDRNMGEPVAVVEHGDVKNDKTQDSSTIEITLDDDSAPIETADEPLSKKRNIGETESEVVIDDNKKVDDVNEVSDDDITMLESFCDVPQED